MRVELKGTEENPLCVLGAVDNTKGRAIEKTMTEWLSKLYRLHIVWHDGSSFEYPALSYMQMLCQRTGKPCLYLHTKGAYNKPVRSYLIRQMWKEEFGEKRDYYQSLVDTEEPTVVCQFTGEDRLTRYNGFIANKAAMESIPAILPYGDRMVFEKLFANSKSVKIIGTVYEDIVNGRLRKAHNYLQKYM